MQDVLVIQSYREGAMNDWISVCNHSVRNWAAMQGYQYCFQGDELFDLLPQWYKHKLPGRLPIWADLARLLWIQNLLSQGRHQMVIWADIDVLVVSPKLLHIDPASTCVFGYEHWLQRDNTTKSRYRVYKNVHNAFCGFRKGCPVLPFLIEVIQRMIKRVDAEFIAPQFVGPKLLTSLHNTVGFEVDSRFGAVSPDLATAVLQAEYSTLDFYQAKVGSPILAFNLCASLNAGNNLLSLVERLLAEPALVNSQKA